LRRGAAGTKSAQYAKALLRPTNAVNAERSPLQPLQQVAHVVGPDFGGAASRGYNFGGGEAVRFERLQALGHRITNSWPSLSDALQVADAMVIADAASD
jgi:hypothetical protein